MQELQFGNAIATYFMDAERQRQVNKTYNHCSTLARVEEVRLLHLRYTSTMTTQTTQDQTKSKQVGRQGDNDE